MAELGFIGLGIMGKPMTNHHTKQPFEIFLCN